MWRRYSNDYKMYSTAPGQGPSVPAFAFQIKILFQDDSSPEGSEEASLRERGGESWEGLMGGFIEDLVCYECTRSVVIRDVVDQWLCLKKGDHSQSRRNALEAKVLKSPIQQPISHRLQGDYSPISSFT